jgi:hypothetical protein
MPNDRARHWRGEWMSNESTSDPGHEWMRLAPPEIF